MIDVARAAPDGYTIALTPNNPLTAQPHLQKLPYGMDSFRYICLTYYAPYVLIAGPKAPFKTFDEFVKFARAKPENLVYGHPGLASQPQLGMLAVLKAIGADGLGVPFTGAGPMAQALLSGTVMAITETPAVAAASNLPILAALSETRLAALPNVPTMKELRYPANVIHRRRRDRAGQHARRPSPRRWRVPARTRPRARDTRPSPTGSMSRRAICRARRSANCSTWIRSTTPTRSSGWGRRAESSLPAATPKQ